MNGIMAQSFISAWLVAAGGPIEGKVAFIGVFAILLVWLLLMPRRLVVEEGTNLPWWQNTRYWAILIVLIEIAVYYRWG
ncbi:MAG: hypothetical protein GXY83_21980 [Rhodopirellula sp.]|nr:hypothetical protein [Rhodopirellula sp.]